MTDAASMESLLTKEDVSKLLHVSPRTVDYLKSAGILPIVRIGRSVRFRPEAIRDYIDRNTVQTGLGVL